MKKIIRELDTILKPSKIEGIGVFANRNIPKGSKLYWDKKTRKIPITIAKKNKRLHEICEKYCVEKKQNYQCPINFQSMSIIWFLNHSKKPNLIVEKGGWITKKIIKKGKELTINYDSLDKNIPNANYLGKKF